MSGKAIRITVVAAVWATAAAALADGPFNTNLLVNPGAEAGDLSGWTLTADMGGDASCSPTFIGWAPIGLDLPCPTWNFNGARSGNYCFGTSWWYETRNQPLDLLALGFSPAELDAAPQVQFSEWIRSRPDQGAFYFVRFELLDSAQNVITAWEHGTPDDPVNWIQLPPGADWLEESQSFSGYGAGLRYLKFLDGGTDVAGWAGWYGAHFDDASAMLVRAGCRGDTNCDGHIDFADIDPFVAVLSGGACCDGTGYNCDVNGDGAVNFGDIDPFVALLSGGATCP